MQIFLASFARFIVAFTFSFMMIWANELYPTTGNFLKISLVRSSGLGIVFGFGLIGGYVSPYIVEGSKNVASSINPVITLGVIGLVFIVNFCFGVDFLYRRYKAYKMIPSPPYIYCTIPAFFLKETLGEPLKDEIKEMTRRYSIR